MSDFSTVSAPLVDLDELPGWILQDDEDLLVLNKPGWLVCHPSKNGPLSSLVGAVRSYLDVEKLHLVARLDRETSGLVIFAKRPAVARKYQMAIQERKVKKYYLAILEGELKEAIVIDQPIGRCRKGPVHVKNRVQQGSGGREAVTEFKPFAHGGGYTLAGIVPTTGRKHQIRVHAHWLEHPVTGDKLYGPDETLYLEFIEKGWTPRLEAALPLQRQGLHCHRYTFEFEEGPISFTAPLPHDMKAFCESKMGLSPEALAFSSFS